MYDKSVQSILHFIVSDCTNCIFHTDSDFCLLGDFQMEGGTFPEQGCPLNKVLRVEVILDRP
jgi:hypothetical protein